MKDLYKLVNISKQAIHQQKQVATTNLLLADALAEQIIKLRIKHPVMGLKKLYSLLKPEIGRDKFLEIAVANGLKSVKCRSFKRTTYAARGYKYTNLLENKWVTGVNQVWVSDITYFQVLDKFYYISFIMDAYSRYIVGYNLAKTLQANNALEALNFAVEKRKITKTTNLIHHSDKGVQYLSNDYLKVLNNYNVQVSLAKTVLENSHAERLNGIIKNEYLVPYKITDYQHLQKALALAVNYYNQERPHWELNLKNPTEFETELQQIPLSQRTKMNFFVDKTIKTYITKSLFDHE
jgi:putative transposase